MLAANNIWGIFFSVYWLQYIFEVQQRGAIAVKVDLCKGNGLNLCVEPLCRKLCALPLSPCGDLECCKVLSKVLGTKDLFGAFFGGEGRGFIIGESFAF